jgi:hypothetical protein
MRTRAARNKRDRPQPDECPTDAGDLSSNRESLVVPTIIALIPRHKICRQRWRLNGSICTSLTAATLTDSEVTAGSTLELVERPCKAYWAEMRTPFRI